jgi:hypothetical protein
VYDSRNDILYVVCLTRLQGFINGLLRSTESLAAASAGRHRCGTVHGGSADAPAGPEGGDARQGGADDGQRPGNAVPGRPGEPPVPGATPERLVGRGFQCAAASGVRDGGRPPATGLQEQVANHRKRRGSKARVVSVTEKAPARRQVRDRKANTRELPFKCRKYSDDAKTGE